MQRICTECNTGISDQVFYYSIDVHGVPLCRNHQDWIRSLPRETTDETIDLYFALKLRGVPALLEKHDGFKTIDIAVPKAKVNIEIDGSHHNWHAQQALADLKRTYYSFKKGYFTLRIPNSLVRYHFEQTADLITEILEISKSKLSVNYRFKRSK